MADLPRIKVCGLRTSEDVHAAYESGADAMGFVVHPPSPRHLEPEAIAERVREVPAGLATVLVLVDVTPSRAAELLEQTGASWIQLCGDEDPTAFEDFSAPILRRLGVAPGAEVERDHWREVAAGFVLDDPTSAGGSGRPVDPGLAASLAESAPCLLAGGLGPENVRERVLAVAPHGVDASSSLESTRGVKDIGLIRDFVRASRAALFDLAP